MSGAVSIERRSSCRLDHPQTLAVKPPVEIPGLDWKVGPTSTVIGATIWNALVVEATARIQQAKGDAPIAVSFNMPGYAKWAAARGSGCPPRRTVGGAPKGLPRWHGGTAPIIGSWTPHPPPPAVPPPLPGGAGRIRPAGPAE